MNSRDWIQAYEQALEADTQAGVIAHAATEKRRHPRLNIARCILQGVQPDGLELISSQHGIISFFSTTQLLPGHRLRLRLDGRADLHVEIRACHLAAANASGPGQAAAAPPPARFRLEARVLTADPNPPSA